MYALRKLLNKPAVDDWSPLAKFYHADEELNSIANELDSFDGRRDPDRCNLLVNKLRQAQDRVLHIIGSLYWSGQTEMLNIVFPSETERANRDYRAKFPEEIIHDNLPGQLWFGAECLAAGSNIVDHEVESETIRPMARELTRHLDKMRAVLKDQALRDPTQYTQKIKHQLRRFDSLFAEFEFHYVSAMVPVKTKLEYDYQLNVAVLFSECLNKALDCGYFTKEHIDDADPTVMIALPRIAIVWGLTSFQGNALNLDAGREQISDMFKQFYDLLILIRALLLLIGDEHRVTLEKYLITGMPDGGAKLETANMTASRYNSISFIACDGPFHTRTLQVDSYASFAKWDKKRLFGLNENETMEFRVGGLELSLDLPRLNKEGVLTVYPQLECLLPEASYAKVYGRCRSMNFSRIVNQKIGHYNISANFDEDYVFGPTFEDLVNNVRVVVIQRNNLHGLFETNQNRTQKLRRTVDGSYRNDRSLVSKFVLTKIMIFICLMQRNLLSACSEMVSSKDIAMACVDSLMQPADASSSKDQVLVYSTSDGIQNVVLNEEFKTRAKQNINDVIHRLFVCICGVADQLQTNYSSDIRKILKMVLQPVELTPVFEVSGKAATNNAESAAEETAVEVRESISLPTIIGVEWVPDSECENCVACGTSFTLIRRRHHCRNCGRIFCDQCSRNVLPLPELGYERPVRVCNACFFYKINPFSPCTAGLPCQTNQANAADRPSTSATVNESS
ncbi:Lateral signaling target protein 2-like protein [Aphelenchoides bicaudatus]|nr:Lateral signaling target protein 2-like protein [Aphelenchoides bicaudatus]